MDTPPANATRPRPAPPPVPTTGFAARLGGLGLCDLIQLECLRGDRRVLRVVCQGQTGYLYFREGALVHAATQLTSGAAAVREMLGWATGTVESGMSTWPARETMKGPWQRVLLDLTGGNHPALAAAGPGLRAALAAFTQTANGNGAGDEGNAPPVRRTTASAVLAPTGHVIEAAGAPGLPEAAAYAAHMAELIGGFFGFERFCALEASYGDEQLLIGRGKSGNLIARRHAAVNENEESGRDRGNGD